MISIGNHLWQCTVFAIVAALFAMLLRSYSAKLRFWVWFIASTKFLVPFSILITLGARTAYSPLVQVQDKISSSVPVMVRINQPFGVELPVAPTPEPPSTQPGWPAHAMTAVWACGCAGLPAKGWLEWHCLQRAIPASAVARIEPQIAVPFFLSPFAPALHPVPPQP